MSEETIVRQAAPTLAGIKTGSMFPYRFENHAELLEDIRAFNRVLVPRGMCLLLLRVMEKSALLYLYRPHSLEKDLKDQLSQELLQESGYACSSCAACVRHLVERFRSGEDFPHEVGLFLSYPPEDVKGFIDDRDNYKASCMWKIYGDEQKSRKLCERFQKCSACYCRLWERGVGLEKLAVAV